MRLRKGLAALGAVSFHADNVLDLVPECLLVREIAEYAWLRRRL
jgi:hypothetical protein